MLLKHILLTSVLSLLTLSAFADEVVNLKSVDQLIDNPECLEKAEKALDEKNDPQVKSLRQISIGFVRKNPDEAKKQIDPLHKAHD